MSNFRVDDVGAVIPNWNYKLIKIYYNLYLNDFKNHKLNKYNIKE